MLYQLNVCLIEFEVLSLIIGPKKIYVAFEAKQIVYFCQLFLPQNFMKTKPFFPFQYYCLSFLLRRRELESEQIRLFYVRLFISIFKKLFTFNEEKSAVLFFGDLSPVATYGF